MNNTHTTPALPWGAGAANGVSRVSTADPLPGPATATSNPCGQVPLPVVGSHIEVRITCARESNLPVISPVSDEHLQHTGQVAD